MIEKFIICGFGSRFILYYESHKDIFLYFNVENNKIPIGSSVCDNCIIKMLYDNTLQCDYTSPWNGYCEPPEKDLVCKRFGIDPEQYNPDYTFNRVFRNGHHINSDVSSGYPEYPIDDAENFYIKIKNNPLLFGKYSKDAVDKLPNLYDYLAIVKNKKDKMFS